MKRTAVSLVVALLLAWFVLPFAFADGASAHACCRARGEHHCSGSETPSETSVSSVCPHRCTAALSNQLISTPTTFAFTLMAAMVTLAAEPSPSIVASPVERSSGRAPPESLS